MSNDKHKNKALRELIKKEKRKFELEEKRLADTKTVEKMQEALKQYHKPDDVIFKIKNKSALKKVLKENKKELTKKIYEVDKQVAIELVTNKAKIEALTELMEKHEKLPEEEDIVNSAKYIIHTQKRIVQTVKPIVLHLQEQGFSTENLDIAQILKESGQFQKGYFSRKWKYKKQNIAFVKIKNNITIFWSFIRGFVYKIQK
jgi:hypothetical protein